MASRIACEGWVIGSAGAGRPRIGRRPPPRISPLNTGRSLTIQPDMRARTGVPRTRRERLRSQAHCAQPIRSSPASDLRQGDGSPTGRPWRPCLAGASLPREASAILHADSRAVAGDLAPVAAGLRVRGVGTGDRADQPVLGAVGVDPTPDLARGLVHPDDVDGTAVTVAAGGAAAAVQGVAGPGLEAGGELWR